MNDQLAAQLEFADAFNQLIEEGPTLHPGNPAGDHARVALKYAAKWLAEDAAKTGSVAIYRSALMVEELSELVDELCKGESLENTLKESCDLQYVLNGTVVAYGLQAVFDDAGDRVHESNMSKLDDNGRPILSASGKGQKGPNYRKADLSDLVKP